MGRTTGAAEASEPKKSDGTDRARHTRRRTHGWRRALLATLITGAVVVPLSGAARPEIPAPAPAAVAAPVTSVTLDEAYAANRANAAEASRMAAAHGNRERAAADRAMADPSRHFLTFDGRGLGLATEVFGDLAHADRIAVLVPGSDTSIDTYDRFREAAGALHERLGREAPQGTRTAVVAWLGYETPATVSTTVATAGRAEEAAPKLREFIRQLRALTENSGRYEPGARTDGKPTGSPHRRPHISLLCHSYGSVVCGRAASDLDVDDIALIGSPGTGADTATALHTPARVWAGRGSDDWVAEVPHIEIDLLGTTVGFGTDPVSPSFGARVFAAGGGGHSDYFRPGSTSLANLTRIVLGETSEVTHG
ncbi:Alpha/beta hydrolase [Streptomyces sp. cf386]|uniref:alpha/beta hydrolase n=1 Tax=Streptomyces sp. cf386 TaxID=1761904 RepID=UPI00088E18A0|nr:alpha/beta hydrolase [Streptomyces sp. cf386]SDO55526.1 Alpha/beta hydrolase [Streptomyces sp. cf386]